MNRFSPFSTMGRFENEEFLLNGILSFRRYVSFENNPYFIC